MRFSLSAVAGLAVLCPSVLASPASPPPPPGPAGNPPGPPGHASPPPPPPQHQSPRPPITCHPKPPPKPLPIPPPRQKVCYVKTHNDGVSDDSTYIMSALHECNDGGHVVFKQGYNYTIGTALDLTFLNHIDIGKSSSECWWHRCR